MHVAYIISGLCVRMVILAKTRGNLSGDYGRGIFPRGFCSFTVSEQVWISTIFIFRSLLNFAVIKQRHLPWRCAPWIMNVVYSFVIFTFKIILNHEFVTCIIKKYPSEGIFLIRSDGIFYFDLTGFFISIWRDFLFRSDGIFYCDLTGFFISIWRDFLFRSDEIFYFDLTGFFL